jgi:hypothetical protein
MIGSRLCVVAAVGLAAPGCVADDGAVDVDAGADAAAEADGAVAAPGPDARPLAIGFTWDDSRLVTFDPVAGSVEGVHLQMGHEAFIGMTYDPGRGVLYAVSQIEHNLYAIAPATMAAAHRGSLRVDVRASRSLDVQAIAYDGTRDVLYGAVVRWELCCGRESWRTDLVHIDVATAGVIAVGTLPGVFVTSLAADDDGSLIGIAEGSDGLNRVVRIDPDHATSEEVLATPYQTMLGLARLPGTQRYVSWINAERHFYGEIDLDRGTITPLGDADAVGVIAAFVHRGFAAAAVAVPRPEIAAAARITGRVVDVRDPDGLLGGSVGAGDRVAGRIAYDVNAPYRWGAAAGGSGIAVSVGDDAFAVDGHAARVENDRWDGYARTVSDSIFLAAERAGPPGFPAPMPHERIALSLTDATARALDHNDTVPAALDPCDWDRRRLVIEGSSDGAFFDGYAIIADIDTIAPE